MSYHGVKSKSFFRDPNASCKLDYTQIQFERYRFNEPGTNKILEPFRIEITSRFVHKS